MAFQEAFKISSVLASIFYGFWVRLGLQHGAILGAKTAKNSKKWAVKILPVRPKSIFKTALFLGIVLDRLGFDFWGVGARFSMIFGGFFELLGLLWACFRKPKNTQKPQIQQR